MVGYVAVLYGITALVDVGSHPYSRYLSHFNQVELKQALKDVGIGYVFLGRELGARPSDRLIFGHWFSLLIKLRRTTPVSNILNLGFLCWHISDTLQIGQNGDRNGCGGS